MDGEWELKRKEEGERTEGVRTNLSVYWEGIRRHVQNRRFREVYKPISAATRTRGLPCVDLGAGEGVAGGGAEEERQRLDEGQVRTKISVFGGGFRRHVQNRRSRLV